jgi:integrase
VDAITTDMVLATLKPKWLTRNASTARLRLRIERVLDYAKAKGYRDSTENPARWRGHLQFLLRKPEREVRHHPALDIRDVPGFFQALAAVDTFGSRAMRFIMLTLARSNEALGARWPEIDFDAAVWSVPRERMKARKAHRVPLSDPAVALLRELHGMRVNEFVFPSVIPGRAMGNNSLFNLLRRIGRPDVTAHGFRSTFADWCAERGVASEVREQCLAHTVGTKIVRAYLRTDIFDQRRELMDQWGAFVTSEGAAKVNPLRR